MGDARASGAPLASPLRLYDFALTALGWLAAAGVLACALHDASQAFDSWYYHLPFAARLVGILPEASFVFHPANQSRYAGFALLAELFQGILWRLSGRAESANLVAFASVPLVAWFVWSRWRVPRGLTMLALLAIPLVQTHAPSAYVDLPGNAAATVLVLLVVEIFCAEGPVATRDVLLALLTGAIAANIKPLLQPAVGLCLFAILVRVVRDKSARRLAVAMIAASPLVLFTPLKNAILHGNPFYPIGTHLFGTTLPGPEEPYASAPAWLEHWPRQARFVVSLLEIGIRPLDDPRRWTVDQWMPEESGANRLGGFFHAYVVASLLFFLWRTTRTTSRRDRVAGVVCGLFTLLIASMPQSHELRYYLSWMMVLVCLNLALARGSAAELRTLGTVAALSFAVVVASTRGAYAFPLGQSVRDLVQSKTDANALATLKEGERVCVKREPFNLLWADIFHGPKRYTVVEAESLEDCRGVREIAAPR